MKKKIKDLTIKEASRICVKFKYCINCSLFSLTNGCMVDITKDDNDDEEKEVEIDE